MSPRRPIAAGVLALSAALLAGTSLADAGDPVVVQVGGSTLGKSRLEARLRAMPRFQLESFGKSTGEIRRAVVERVVVPELLAAEEARRKNLADTPRARARSREIYARALEDALIARVERENPVTAADVERYFAAHRARFEKPRRIRIWRIVVGDRAAAQALIAAAAGTPGMANWSKAAREQSLDKATAMRQGDLGFVHADGQTDVPSVRVDPALFAAADAVRDGELVPEPVPEGKNFAAVWRRGSLAAVSRTLADEERSIRESLSRERVQEARQRLIDELRQRHVTDLDPTPLDALTLDAFGPPEQRKQPGSVASVNTVVPALPSATDRGLR